MSPKPDAAGFAGAFFAKHGADVAWLKTEAAALRVVAPDVPSQVGLIEAAKKHCATLEFPKDANLKSFVQQAFKALFLSEIADVEAFEAWRDGDDDSDAKVKALMQTTEFFSYLDTIDDVETDEEEEGDEEEEEEEEMVPM